MPSAGRIALVSSPFDHVGRHDVSRCASPALRDFCTEAADNCCNRARALGTGAAGYRDQSAIGMAASSSSMKTSFWYDMTPAFLRAVHTDDDAQPGAFFGAVLIPEPTREVTFVGAFLCAEYGRSTGPFNLVNFSFE